MAEPPKCRILVCLASDKLCNYVRSFGCSTRFVLSVKPHVPVASLFKAIATKLTPKTDLSTSSSHSHATSSTSTLLPENAELSHPLISSSPSWRATDKVDIHKLFSTCNKLESEELILYLKFNDVSRDGEADLTRHLHRSKAAASSRAATATTHSTSTPAARTSVVLARPSYTAHETQDAVAVSSPPMPVAAAAEGAGTGAAIETRAGAEANVRAEQPPAFVGYTVQQQLQEDKFNVVILPWTDQLGKYLSGLGMRVTQEFRVKGGTYISTLIRKLQDKWTVGQVRVFSGSLSLHSCSYAASVNPTQSPLNAQWTEQDAVQVRNLARIIGAHPESGKLTLYVRFFPNRLLAGGKEVGALPEPITQAHDGAPAPAGALRGVMGMRDMRAGVGGMQGGMGPGMNVDSPHQYPGNPAFGKTPHNGYNSGQYPAPYYSSGPLPSSHDPSAGGFGAGVRSGTAYLPPDAYSDPARASTHQPPHAQPQYGQGYGYLAPGAHAQPGQVGQHMHSVLDSFGRPLHTPYPRNDAFLLPPLPSSHTHGHLGTRAPALPHTFASHYPPEGGDGNVAVDGSQVPLSPSRMIDTFRKAELALPPFPLSGALMMTPEANHQPPLRANSPHSRAQQRSVPNNNHNSRTPPTRDHRAAEHSRLARQRPSSASNPPTHGLHADGSSAASLSPGSSDQAYPPAGALGQQYLRGLSAAPPTSITNSLSAPENKALYGRGAGALALPSVEPFATSLSPSTATSTTYAYTQTADSGKKSTVNSESDRIPVSTSARNLASTLSQTVSNASRSPSARSGAVPGRSTSAEAGAADGGVHGDHVLVDNSPASFDAMASIRPSNTDRAAHAHAQNGRDRTGTDVSYQDANAAPGRAFVSASAQIRDITLALSHSEFVPPPNRARAPDDTMDARSRAEKAQHTLITATPDLRSGKRTRTPSRTTTPRSKKLRGHETPGASVDAGGERAALSGMELQLSPDLMVGKAASLYSQHAASSRKSEGPSQPILASPISRHPRAQPTDTPAAHTAKATAHRAAPLLEAQMSPPGTGAVYASASTATATASAAPRPLLASPLMAAPAPSRTHADATQASRVEQMPQLSATNTPPTPTAYAQAPERAQAAAADEFNDPSLSGIRSSEKPIRYAETLTTYVKPPMTPFGQSSLSGLPHKFPPKNLVSPFLPKSGSAYSRTSTPRAALALAPSTAPADRQDVISEANASAASYGGGNASGDSGGDHKPSAQQRRTSSRGTTPRAAATTTVARAVATGDMPMGPPRGAAAATCAAVGTGQEGFSAAPRLTPGSCDTAVSATETQVSTSSRRRLKFENGNTPIHAQVSHMRASASARSSRAGSPYAESERARRLSDGLAVSETSPLRPGRMGTHLHTSPHAGIRSSAFLHATDVTSRESSLAALAAAGLDNSPLPRLPIPTAGATPPGAQSPASTSSSAPTSASTSARTTGDACALPAIATQITHPKLLEGTREASLTADSQPLPAEGPVDAGITLSAPTHIPNTLSADRAPCPLCLMAICICHASFLTPLGNKDPLATFSPGLPSPMLGGCTPPNLDKPL